MEWARGAVRTAAAIIDGEVVRTGNATSPALVRAIHVWKGARRHVGRVLAKSVAGDERRKEPLRREHAVRRHADRQDPGLLNLGQPQLILWTRETEL